MIAGLLLVAVLGAQVARLEMESRTSNQTSPASVVQSQPALYDIDLSRSYVQWTGTKFRGRGKHEGVVRLLSGALGPCNAANCRGRFTMDMHNLEITDIPVRDAVPRRRLLEHLRSRDFFWTARYPDATFVLVGTLATPSAERVLSASARDSSSFEATGQLTLRGVTQTLTFPARVTARSAQEIQVRAEVVIDRQRWGISYRFDPIRNEIVDDDITLVIVLVARSRVDASRVDLRQVQRVPILRLETDP